jgi:ribosomal protein L37E
MPNSQQGALAADEKTDTELKLPETDGKCLKCGKDALDTGWECTECGYDNRQWYYPQGEQK